MSDLISRQAATEAIEKLYLPLTKGETEAKEINRIAWRCALSCAEGIIGTLPPAEPEIIRCKDCKHWYNDADTGMACEYTNMSQPEDGFCNWAERR